MSHWPADDRVDDSMDKHEYTHLNEDSRSYFLPCNHVDVVGRKCHKPYSADIHRTARPNCGWCIAVEGSQGGCTCKTMCTAAKCPANQDNVGLYHYVDNVPVPRFRKD